jgi:transposase-like protein
MSFGKYPVAFGILYGNEDKEGWIQFWKFTKTIRPSINATNVTIITDQAKGLIESISEALPLVVHVHCSFHRHQNIIKIVRVRGALRNTLVCGWSKK